MSHYRIVDPTPLMTHERVKSLADQVYRRVRQDIIEGRWSRGEPLLESELAAEFDVSKTPVREALRMLVQEEWATALPGRGYLVRTLGLRDIGELFDLLLMIEPALVAAIARNPSLHEIAALRAQLDVQRAAPDAHRSLDAARQFHLAVASLSRNHRAEVFIERLFAEVRRLHYVLPRHLTRVAAEAETAAHAEILGAIVDHRHEEAAVLMRAHLAHSAAEIAASFASAKVGKYISGIPAESLSAAQRITENEEHVVLREGSFDSDGVRIAFTEAGEGDALVLLHGFSGTARAGWIDPGLFDEFAREFRVIAYDARGHGGSDKPRDPASYGRELGLDIVRLLDHLGIDRAHLAGISMGAHTVMHLLTMHPERVLSATLAGSPGRLDWTDEDRARIELESDELAQGSPRSMILRLWPAGEPRPSDDEIDRIAQNAGASMASGDLDVLAAVRRSAVAQIVTSAEVARITVPTLGIVGTRDPYLDAFRALKRSMPQLRLVEIEGADHGSTYGHSEFLPAMLAHLRQAVDGHDASATPQPAASPG